MILLIVFFSFAEKIYVVERERGAVLVIEKDLLKEIKGVGNTNHAILKFKGKFAYLVSRDGYISKIDTERDSLLRKVKVGDSSIGFTFCKGKISVANYSPKNVVILSEDLEVLKKISTGSRNVGIKSFGNLLIFSLMDRDEVWVIDCSSMKVIKRFRNVGKMPFDALLSGNRYIVGFFGENSVGVLDLSNMTFRKVKFGKRGREIVLKIPHFGLWGVCGTVAYIPAVGERKIHIVDLKRFEYIGSIEVPGLPVFVSVSPDGKYLGVNFSGDSENLFALIDRIKGKVLKAKKLGKRILHFRFSPNGKSVYVSSYFENQVKRVSIPDLEVLDVREVPTPSGIFLKRG